MGTAKISAWYHQRAQMQTCGFYILKPRAKPKKLSRLWDKALGFDYVSVFRPGLLITERDKSQMGEKLAQCIAGALGKSNKASIKVEDVAKAMILNATKRTSAEKVETFEP